MREKFQTPSSCGRYQGVKGGRKMIRGWGDFVGRPELITREGQRTDSSRIFYVGGSRCGNVGMCEYGKRGRQGNRMNDKEGVVAEVVKGLIK
jgi:hypothetical protein